MEFLVCFICVGIVFVGGFGCVRVSYIGVGYVFLGGGNGMMGVIF